MQALYLAGHGGVEQVRFGELPTPVARPGEVLVSVAAAAFNHIDLFVLGGLPGTTLEMPHVGGADGAGVIAALGPGVTGWREGDEVVLNPGLWCGECEFCRRGEESLCVRFGVLGEHAPGTFAEYVKVPAGNLGPRPEHLSWSEASAFPLTFLTAWRMLTTRGRLQPDETVLIHGVGGGVALAALAIAKRMGARVIVTSSSAEKLARARQLGADETIDYSSADVARAVRALTGKRGVDLVVETAGSATWMSSLRSAAKGGRIVTCGATTGPSPAEEIRLVFWNQLSILGSTMGSRADWEAMLAAVRDWQLRPVVDSVLPIERGREGYQRLARGGQFGKIVLQLAAAPPELDRA